MTERRNEEIILYKIVLPIVVAVVTGVSSSFIGVKIALSVTQTEVKHIKQLIAPLSELRDTIMIVENEVKNNTRRIDRLEK